MVEIEKVKDDGELVALIVRGNDYAQGVFFPTDEKTPFQIGLHKQERGKKVEAHYHYPVSFPLPSFF
jgi:hypothetical protein